jgi:hypothetical protein
VAIFIIFSSFFSAYAFAELIDNSLAATADNQGVRLIEIRLVSNQDFEGVNTTCGCSWAAEAKAVFWTVGC